MVIAELSTSGKALRTPIRARQDSSTSRVRGSTSADALAKLKRVRQRSSAFSAIAKERSGALLVQPLFSSSLGQGKKIADLAVRNRLPTMSDGSSFAEAGGLMLYGPNQLHSAHRVAVLVDKILKGAKPSDLPVEQPTTFEFVINLKTAKALNLTIPQSVLYRADRVIR